MKMFLDILNEPSLSPGEIREGIIQKEKEKKDFLISDLINELNNFATLNIKNGKIEKVKIEKEFNTEEINKENKKLLKLISLNMLSPNSLSEKIEKVEWEVNQKEEIKLLEINKLFIKDFLEINVKDKDIVYENGNLIKITENLKKESEFIYTGVSTFNTSFGLLKRLSEIDYIEEINLTFLFSINKEERKESEVLILNENEMNYVKNRKNRNTWKSKEFQSKMISLSRIVSHNDFLNIKIKIELKKDISNFRKVQIIRFLKDNGLKVTNRDDRNEIMSVSYFEALLLLGEL